MAAIPAPAQTKFRTCPVTALKVDLTAEKLIKANAVTAIVFLAIGGLFALLLAFTRWQAVHLLPADWFYRILTAHGLDMLVVWIVFFEVAGLYFGSTVVLNARLALPKVAWGAFILMLAGTLMINAIVLLGKADVLFTAYWPLKAHPVFYLGVILFAVGALVSIFVFFATIVTAKKEKAYEGSLPLFTYGLVAAAIIATYALLSGALAFIPAWLGSMGIMDVDPEYYRNLFWGFGHTAQQINLAAMVSIWYALAQITVGAVPVNEKFSRFAFILYLLAINLGSAHHLLSDPGYNFAWKTFNTSYLMYIAVLGSLIHAFSIPAAVEVAQRRKGYTNGLFDWLRKAPWKEPGFSALVISMMIFGWIGGVTGVTIGTEQINMTAHNTMRLPGHFHATVVAGTTLAFMGITYYLIPLIFRKPLKFKKVASWQPYMYGLGMLIVSIFMIAAGLMGAPRRDWQIDLAAFPGATGLMFAIVAFGATIAVIGGLMFLLVVLASVFTGKQEDAHRLTLVMKQENPLVEDALSNVGKEATGKFAPSGTMVIVFVFLMFFVVYYFSNWWLLGRAWFIH